MTFPLVITLVLVTLTVIGIIIAVRKTMDSIDRGFKKVFENIGKMIQDAWKEMEKMASFGLIRATVIIGAMALISSGVTIAQPVQLKQEQIRQTKERETIISQITLVESNPDKYDKVKINEWILTYNDWVNDINAEKETYGWFAWHAPFDMSAHNLIDLI